jgi:hypothetical protein
MAWQRQGDGQGSHPSGRALDTTLGFKEPLVLILGQPPRGYDYRRAFAFSPRYKHRKKVD